MTCPPRAVRYQISGLGPAPPETSSRYHPLNDWLNVNESITASREVRQREVRDPLHAVGQSATVGRGGPIRDGPRGDGRGGRRRYRGVHPAVAGLCGVWLPTLIRHRPTRHGPAARVDRPHMQWAIYFDVLMPLQPHSPSAWGPYGGLESITHRIARRPRSDRGDGQGNRRLLRPSA